MKDGPTARCNMEYAGLGIPVDSAIAVSAVKTEKLIPDGVEWSALESMGGGGERFFSPHVC